ncbi:MAG: methionine adenosyltransferase [Clostridia bacterium]|nr:methionine adenosyltransferase [Clostridia bacterium]MBP3555734.1 methionine adenosyltransferase [Clostridia bacterium]MBQ8418945.1 methionine adenosyltransferase [Clostridia bacterium]
MEKKYFSTESVTEGHPDKVCDRISDSVIDQILAADPMARVACETTATTNFVMVMGEITTTANIDYEKTVRDAIAEIGYTKDEYGFNASTCEFVNRIHTQSPDIAMGVDKCIEAKTGAQSDKYDTGAGDQGMMFGFACDETETLMPLGYVLASNMAKKLTEVRKNGTLSYLRPDGKTQVTVEYDGDTPVRLENVVVSTQHDPDVSLEQIRADIIEHVIKTVVPANFIDENTEIFVNPTGRFVIGGPTGDSGLTGRKIIVDTYGGYGRHGGGAFSGKDPTKVDRSACYAARYCAKNVVAAGLAKKCEVQISYAIGVAKPLCVNVNTFGTGKISDERIAEIVRDTVDLRPAAIIDYFELRRPIYAPLSAYGHFGREDLGVKWESRDIADTLRAKAGL